MKKFSIYGLMAVMSLGFVACDDYEEPNPAPQTNPQTSILQTSDVTVASRVVEAGYDLKVLNDQSESILIADITVPQMPDGYSFKAVGTLEGINGQKGELPLDVALDENTGLYNVTVTADALQGVYYSNISHNPETTAATLTFLLYTVNGTQEAVVGGPENVYGPYGLKFTPFPPVKVIEDAYYVVGTASDGTVAKAVKLQHSDINQYDDPVFSGKFDVTPGWKWQIIPASTFAAGKLEGNTVIGVTAGLENDLAGDLVAVADGGVEGVLNEGNPYVLSVDLAAMKYSFSVAYEQLYTPGNSNGWSQTASQILTTTDYITYTGYAYLNGEFKFTTQPDWNGTNLGSTGVAGELTSDGGAGNINSGSEGLFWCTVNISNMTYKLDAVSTYGIIGDATPKGWDASTPLTPSANFLVWTGKVTLGEGEFKFRANDDWTLNLGGDMNNLTPGGDNLKSPGAGTYTITLDLSTVPYSCKLTK